MSGNPQAEGWASQVTSKLKHPHCYRICACQVSAVTGICLASILLGKCPTNFALGRPRNRSMSLPLQEAQLGKLLYLHLKFCIPQDSCAVRPSILSSCIAFLRMTASILKVRCYCRGVTSFIRSLIPELLCAFLLLPLQKSHQNHSIS